MNINKAMAYEGHVALIDQLRRRVAELEQQADQRERYIGSLKTELGHYGDREGAAIERAEATERRVEELEGQQ